MFQPSVTSILIQHGNFETGKLSASNQLSPCLICNYLANKYLSFYLITAWFMQIVPTSENITWKIKGIAYLVIFTTVYLL